MERGVPPKGQGAQPSLWWGQAAASGCRPLPAPHPLSCPRIRGLCVLVALILLSSLQGLSWWNCATSSFPERGPHVRSGCVWARCLCPRRRH